MKKDTGWKRFFSDGRRYADLINGLGCGGRQMIAEEDLQELDTQAGPFQSRDLVRKAAFGVNFAVIGIENQEAIDYAFPLRNMTYDVTEYGKQAARIRKKVRGHTEALSAGEYLYGFRKDSRLHPVITFLLYSGEREWDGPLSLHGMTDFAGLPHSLKEMVPDYRVNLIEIRKWKDTDVFHTDVTQVFDFIRCAEDKQALSRLVAEDPSFRAMEEDAYDVVTQYAHAEELIGKKDDYRREGKIDMCTAIREMVQDGIEQGRSMGIEQGISRGEALLAELMNRLFQAGRMDDVRAAIQDQAARKRLYQEYGMSEYLSEG